MLSQVLSVFFLFSQGAWAGNCNFHLGPVEHGAKFRSPENIRKFGRILGSLAPNDSEVRFLGSGGSSLGVCRVTTGDGRQSTFKIFHTAKIMKRVTNEMAKLLAVYRDTKPTRGHSFRIATYDVRVNDPKAKRFVVQVTNVPGRSLERVFGDPSLSPQAWESSVNRYLEARADWADRLAQMGYIPGSQKEDYEEPWGMTDLEGDTIIMQPSAVVIDVDSHEMTVIDPD